ncbi:polysaccharide deacetylase family protein [Pseudoflavonifractor phocaeensis]|uniref:polysaccharide deacetylase family protein n=1 Tax=Pseudoflavonifractor phocaeensis TaxID=1870988 RepID=UPI001959D08A|nr:polysaccharide deacetylase family protein [Pseudoflavonifractor phocaeensis]MBM6939336.1 polysaccharide deacetylase family protein [Pseudoflavonifractor phocaeensis]
MGKKFHILSFLFRLAAGLLLLAVLLCAAGVGAAAARPLTVLMYHHIVADDGPVNAMTVTARRFEADMRWLKEAGYTTVLPRELAAGLPLPEKAVLVTFDDGYASNYQYAFPVLQSLNMKAAIAVVGRLVDADDPLYLTWDMCREMDRSGLVEIGSHSYDLHNLDADRRGLFVQGGPNGIQRLENETEDAYHQRVDADLLHSIQDIQDHLDRPVTFLAYPFGVTEPWADSFLRAHFALTLTTREDRCDPADGLYDLPRLAVTMDRSARDCFSLKTNILLFIKEFKP